MQTKLHNTPKKISLSPKLQKRLVEIARLGSQGHLLEAQKHCEAILKIIPNQPHVLHYLGLSLLQQGHPEKALVFVQKAFDRGLCSSDVCNHLGAIYGSLGNYAKAIEFYRNALRMNPQLIEANYNLGLAYQRAQRYEEAIGQFKLIIERIPHHAEAHNQLANALQSQGKIDDALTYYKKAISLLPNQASYYYNQAQAFKHTSDLTAAEKSYLDALRLNPAYVEAINNLGVIYLENHYFEKAIQCFEKALSLQPNFTSALKNIGDVWSKKEEYSKAANYYRRAIEQEPENIAFLDAYVLMLKSDADWHRLDGWKEKLITLSQKKIAVSEEVNISPFHSLSLDLTGSQQRDIAQQHAQTLSKGIEERQSIKIKRMPKAKLRIAYISGDFRDHPVAHLISGLFEQHDREKVEVFAYSLGPNDNSVYCTRIQSTVDEFIDLSSVSLKNSLEVIDNDNIDIAIDLMGYTNYARPELFAHRIAPVQIGFLGYPGTSGSTWMDYYIADTTVLPPEKANAFSEKIIYLPQTYFATDNKLAIAKNGPSPEECGLPPNKIVYCCFCTHYKLEPRAFAAWMTILQAVPDSVLWLYSRNRTFETHLRREAEKRDVNGERLIFAYRETKECHLARHQHADIFLDTFTYNAHTTAVDALWTGLPLITLLGDEFPGRVSASLLQALELPELITTNVSDYIKLAIDYGLNLNKIHVLKMKLQEKIKTAALFNTAHFTQQIEEALRMAWQDKDSADKAAPLFIS